MSIYKVLQNYPNGIQRISAALRLSMHPSHQLQISKGPAEAPLQEDSRQTRVHVTAGAFCVALTSVPARFPQATCWLMKSIQDQTGSLDYFHLLLWRQDTLWSRQL